LRFQGFFRDLNIKRSQKVSNPPLQRKPFLTLLSLKKGRDDSMIGLKRKG